MRRERRALDAVLADQLERRIEVGGVAFGLRLRDWNAVVNNLLLEIDTAADAMGEGVAGRARGEELKWIYLAAPATYLSGQGLHHHRLDGAAHFRLRRIQRNLVGSHLDCFARRAVAKHEVDGRVSY